MNVRQRILGEIGTRSGQRITKIDVGVLVRRLILFDKVIIKSFRFRQIPFLAHTFGKAGLSALLQSGLLHFNCNFNAVITDSDIRANTPALRAALVDKLRTLVAPGQLDLHRIEVTVEETSNRIFRVQSKSPEPLGLSPEQTHTVLHGAVSAVANLDQRLADMQAHSAITGFLETEAPILFGKLAGIMAPMNPKIAEGQFERVIELTGIPDFNEGQRVNVELLMKVREGAECREFREWLGTLDSVSDADLEKMISGVRSRLASLAGSIGGKVIRLAATTAVGLIPGVNLLVGVAASAIDSFLVDQVLPKSGVVAFLTQSYPSLFESP